jgi:hypothetical protein
MRVERIAPASLWRYVAERVRDAFQSRGRLATVRRTAKRLAGERSRELLLRCLTPAQRAEFERTRGFTVRGQSGRRYRIAYGTTANVEVLGQGGELEYRLCAGPADLPTASVMLAQKLMLERREAEFLRIAARHARPIVRDAAVHFVVS